MKINRKFFLALIFSLLIINQAFSQNLYVSEIINHINKNSSNNTPFTNYRYEPPKSSDNGFRQIFLNYPEKEKNGSLTNIISQPVVFTRNTASSPLDEACAGEKNFSACKQDVFVGCAATYFSKDEMPSVCSSFDSGLYADFINYGFENPNQNVGDYFLKAQTNLGDNFFIFQKISDFASGASFKDILASKKKGEESGWATCFGHCFGKKDKLLGTAQFKGYTGFCNQFNSNPGCYNVYKKDVCIVSLPKSSLAKHYSLPENFRKDQIRKIIDEKPQVEVKNTSNGKCTVATLGDVGPGELTGNSIDLTGCVVERLSGNGKFHTKYKILNEGEEACGEEKVFNFSGFVEKIFECNCSSNSKKVMLVSQVENRKRMVGIFAFDSSKYKNVKEGDSVIGTYLPAESIPRMQKYNCYTRSNKFMCSKNIKGISGSEYTLGQISGEINLLGSEASSDI